MHETEIRYRMERLRAEADHARFGREARAASGPARPGRVRRLVGRLLIGLGSAVEGAAPCPDERTEGARA